MPQTLVTAPAGPSATLTSSMGQVVTDANAWLAAASGTGKWSALFSWLLRQVNGTLGLVPTLLPEFTPGPTALAALGWSGDGGAGYTAPSSPSATLTASMATAMNDAAAWLAAADALAPKDGSGARRALGDWLLLQLLTVDSGRLRPSAGMAAVPHSNLPLASRTWTAWT